MRIDARLLNACVRIGNSNRFSIYLSVALLVFLLSFFLLEVSKQRNNIFYLLLAVPALLFGLPAVWVALRSWLGCLLIVHFSFFVISQAVIGDDFIGVLKHSIYIVLLLACLAISRRSTEGFKWSATAYVVFVVGVAIWSIYLWVDHYYAAGRFMRVTLSGAASNPVHAGLMLLTGWLGFWIVFALPYLARRGRCAYAMGFVLMLGFAFFVCIVFQARSALLGMIAALIVLLLVGRERLLSFAVTLFLIGGVIIFNGYEALLARGVSYRTEIWQDALSLWYTSCSWVFGCSEGAGVPFLGKFHHAHSAYVSVLIDSGVVGALSFFVFAVFYCWKGFQVRSPWFAVSMIGWAGVMVSSNGLITSPRPLWIYFWIPTLLAMLDFARVEVTNVLGRENKATN